MSLNQSPEIRRAIATLFRKSTLEEKGELIIKDVLNMCNKIEKEANEGKIDSPSSSQLLAIYRYAISCLTGVTYTHRSHYIVW